MCDPMPAPERERANALWVLASGDILAGRCPSCKEPTEDSWLTVGWRWECPSCEIPSSLMERTR